MKNTTITPVLWTRKDKNNLFPVKIRKIVNRKSEYVSLGFSVSKSHWLKSTRRISTSHPEHQELNYLIEKKLKELSGFQEKFGKIKMSNTNLLTGLMDKINSLSGEHYYSRKRYKTLYYHLEGFWGNQDLNYYDINREFFIDFRDYLERVIEVRSKNNNNKPSSNTIVNYLNTLKTFLIEKQSEGLFLTDLGFTRKIIPKKSPTGKRTLSNEEIWKLDNILISHPGFRPLLWNSLNIFMFSFWCQGLRIGDCLRLRWGNIVDGMIDLKMEKTKQNILIPLNPSILKRIIWYTNYQDVAPVWSWEKRKYLNYDSDWDEIVSDFNLVKDIGKNATLSSTFSEYITWCSYLEELMEDCFSDFLLQPSYAYLHEDKYGVRFHNFLKEQKPDFFDSLVKFENGFIRQFEFEINPIVKSEEYRNQFIFPFLRGYENEKDLNKLANKVSSSIALINKSLKEIQSILNIQTTFSCHFARHTITSISKSLGTDAWDLKSFLGHTSIKTTESYISSINTQSSIQNAKKVKDFLDGLNK